MVSAFLGFNDFSVLLCDGPEYWEHLTDRLNFCCLNEACYVCSERFSSPYLKRQHQAEESVHMDELRYSVQHLTIAIEIKIRQLNVLHMDNSTGDKSCHEIWKFNE